MTIRAHRILATGALAVVAVAAPIGIALTSVDAAVNAGPKCLSSVTTNGSDPICVGYSNGQPIQGSTIGGIYGPNTPAFGIGATGGLVPGQTWTTPIS